MEEYFIDSGARCTILGNSDYLSCEAIMAHNVSVWMTNWHWTGSNIPVPQAEVDITVHWTDDGGTKRERSVTAQFPNCLHDVPVAWLKDELEDLILRAVRKKLEVDR